MTEKEAEYWDDYYTKNTIMPDLNKPGHFSRKYGMTVILDPETTRTLTHYAATENAPDRAVHPTNVTRCRADKLILQDNVSRL